MKPFKYANGTTLDEVTTALDGQTRLLAGGTDLLTLLKEGLVAPERLINVRALDGLQGVKEDKDAGGWCVGALTTLSELAADETLAAEPALSALREAALESASPQIRHRATLGGNLMQHPRCWYYRNQLTFCWHKGGRRCFAARGENKYHAILGGGPCFYVHPSDPAVALLALDATVEIRGPDGVRSVAIGDFFHPPQVDDRTRTVVAENEIVTQIRLPHPPPDGRTASAFIKIAERGVWDFALVSAAVRLVLDESSAIQTARVALGGVAPVPWRAEASEEVLASRVLDEATLTAAAEAATEGARPLAQNEHKIDLAQGAVRAALRRLSQAPVD